MCGKRDVPAWRAKTVVTRTKKEQGEQSCALDLSREKYHRETALATTSLKAETCRALCCVRETSQKEGKGL